MKANTAQHKNFSFEENSNLENYEEDNHEVSCPSISLLIGFKPKSYIKRLQLQKFRLICCRRRELIRPRDFPKIDF